MDNEPNVLELGCDNIETPEQLSEYLQELSAGEDLAIALNIRGEHQLDLKLMDLRFALILIVVSILI